ARSVPKLGRALRRSAIEAKEPAEPLAALDPTASSASPDESMRPLQIPCQVLRLDQSPGHPVWPKHDRVSPPLSGPAVAARLLVSVHVLASLPVQVAKQDLRCRVGFTDAWCTIAVSELAVERRSVRPLFRGIAMNHATMLSSPVVPAPWLGRGLSLRSGGPAWAVGVTWPPTRCLGAVERFCGLCPDTKLFRSRGAHPRPCLGRQPS